jgi:hypothetical protein
MEWSPNQKAAIAEAEVAAAATRLGVPVLKPLFEDRRYDLVFETDRGLVKVQCKWARRRRNVIAVNARTFRLRSGGSWERTTYSPDEVDAVAAYCPDVHGCFLVPIGEFPPSGCFALRLEPAKNNQLKGLHSAAEYELSLGAIAQLGERVTGSHEVAGSSPASSTSEEPRVARLVS